MKMHLCCLLYLPMYLPLPVFFISSCGVELWSCIPSYKPEEISSVYLVRQVCYWKILCLCLSFNILFFFLKIWRTALLDITLLVDNFAVLWICHLTTFWPSWFLKSNHLSIILRIAWFDKFLFAAFKILFVLCITSLTMRCLGVVLFESVLPRIYWASSTHRFTLISNMGSFQPWFLENILSSSFLLELPLCTYWYTWWCLTFFLLLLYLCSSDEIISIELSSSSLIFFFLQEA